MGCGAKMGNTELWVWLTSKEFINSGKVTSLLEHFDSIEEIYNADFYDDITGIDEKEKRDLLDKRLDGAEKIIEKINAIGARIVTFEDENYPPPLRQIAEPPYVLYMKGKEMDWENTFSLSVIGSRQCTDYGRVVCQKLCYELASKGVTIVSGMARGIDSISSIAAIRAGGSTIAVLGCGIDIVYPPENAKLMEAIEQYGVVMTEYPPSFPPYGHNFPQRNRIISGLSRGLLVIEAGKKSGTHTTIKRTWESGKEVFAVPGGIFHKESQGTNDWIKKGAILTTCANDIIEKYPEVFDKLKADLKKPQNIKIPEWRTYEKKEALKKKPEKAQPRKIDINDKRFEGLNPEERLIIQVILNGASHIDEIARESKIKVAKLNAILPILEMTGIIEKAAGNKYTLGM